MSDGGEETITLIKMIGMLEDDGARNVCTDFEISDEVMAKLMAV